jgi:hypothetical protein
VAKWVKPASPIDLTRHLGGPKFKSQSNLIIVIEYCYLVRNIYTRKKRIYKIREFDQSKIG